MAQELQERFLKLPTEDILTGARHELKKLAEIGFGVPSLRLLITGTSYRKDTLYYRELQTYFESHNFAEMPENERIFLWEKYKGEYDNFSGVNLTETLRYQYDRETRENQLDRSPFPSPETKEYQEILTIMTTLGAYLKELQRRTTAEDFLPFVERVEQTAADMLQKASDTIRHLITSDKSDPEKAEAATFELSSLCRGINKLCLQGDPFPSEKLRKLEFYRDEMRQLLDSQAFSAVLTTLAPDGIAENQLTILEQILTSLNLSST